MRCMRIRQDCGSNALRLIMGEKGLKHWYGIIVIPPQGFPCILLGHFAQWVKRSSWNGDGMALEFANHSSIRKIPQ
jgi:hypothetical protein